MKTIEINSHVTLTCSDRTARLWAEAMEATAHLRAGFADEDLDWYFFEELYEEEWEAWARFFGA